ncbi:MarR family winged helix-turn-helix transcriptional regulator [Microlunatus speluncae]|uniref:MarR family winged helix-turn-helix transcriptional regulator n=1 Tax=Microlunatus speluncae TaxID=2594267 RepID=UPI00137558AD|nr:MarR family transcriptional regulator [Microlunatus speluncae]
MVSDSPTELLNRLLALSMMLSKDMAVQLGQAGLTPARTHLLMELHQRGPVTQQTLAAALQVSPRNVTSLVDGLVESGHATRERHPDDRRAFLVTLTELGATAAAAMDRDHAQLARDLFGSLPADDRAAAARTLAHAEERLNELFQAHYGKREPS